VVAATLRRSRVHPAMALASSIAAMVVTVSMVMYRASTTVGIPSRETWHLASNHTRDAWRAFPDARAPIAGVGGFLLWAVIGIFVIALLSDAFAFRARAGIEAVIPAGVMLVIAAMTGKGSDRLRVPLTVVQMSATFVFLACHRAWVSHRTATWLTGPRKPDSRGVIGAGLLVAGGAVALGALVAPILPGAHDRALYDYQRAIPTSAKRVTLNPLVDIRGRIASQSRVEAFRVQSPIATYWRITTLNVFDGKTWKGDTRYSNVDNGEELAGVPKATNHVDADATFTISNLRDEYVPVANNPTRIEGLGKLSYSKDAGSVLLRSGRTEPGAYTVSLRVPRVDAAVLRAAPAELDGVSSKYLDLPSDFPQSVRDEATSVTADATTPYDRARLLQDWFRSNFDYSIDVRAGGDQPIVTFLAQRIGYCEQFSGTFAAMARSLGLPARVAVGFTQGIAQPDGSFMVQGRHAHAWPEVHFAGVGWVAFEPTPNRGIPGATAYTGVQPAQEGDTPTPAPETTVATTVAPTTLPDLTATTLATGPGSETVPVPDGSGESKPYSWVPMIVAGAVALAAAAAWIVGLAVYRRRAYGHRRALAVDDRQRVRLHWSEACEALERTGLIRDRSETSIEYARRVQRYIGPSALKPLAEAETIVAYSPNLLEGMSAQSEAWSQAVVADAHARTTRGQRLLYRLVPHRVAARSAAGRVQGSVSPTTPVGLQSA
jgi:transglutaminase-like putative cysteine protease